MERRLVGRLRELRATQDWAGCMELEAEACSVTVQASEPATAAEIYNTLGNGLEVMGEKRIATERYEQARRAYAETSDQVGEARARRNLKICYFATGQYEQAICCLT
jgi:tetratricopeptide (TPR) repeat protein